MSQAAAYFDIIARTDGIKRAIAQTEVFVKDTKAKIEAIKIKSPVLDSSGFGAQLRGMVTEAEVAAKRIADAMDQRINERAARVTQILRNRSAREAAELPGKIAASIPFDADAEARSRFAGTGSGVAVGVGGGGGPEGLLSTFVKLGIVVKGIESSMKLFRAYGALAAGDASMAAGNYERGLQKYVQFARTVGSIPVVGTLTELFSGGAGAAIEQRAQDIPQTQENTRRMVRERQNNERNTRRAIQSANIGAGGTGYAAQQAQSELNLQSAIEDIDLQVKDKKIGVNLANELKGAVRARYMADKARENEDITAGVNARYSQGEEIQMRMAGRGREAERQALVRQLAEEQRVADRNLGGRDTGTEHLNEARLAEFDLSQKREIVARNAQYEASIRETNLRAAGQTYEADRAAFEAAWDAKLQKIREGGDAEELALAERQMFTEEDARTAANTRQREDLEFQASQIRMRTAGKSRSAEILAIARETEKAIEAAAPENREAVGDVGRARLEAVQRELMIATANTRAEVYASGSFRSTAGGIDTGKETVDVLKNNIAVSLASINEKISATPSTPTAG